MLLVGPGKMLSELGDLGADGFCNFWICISFFPLILALFMHGLLYFVCLVKLCQCLIQKKLPVEDITCIF